VQVEIRLTPDANATASATADATADAEQSKQMIVPMDHTPSWRLHKNPFWRVKHPAGGKNFTTGNSLQQSQQQHQYQSPPQSQFSSSEYRSEHEHLSGSSNSNSTVGSGVLHAYEASQDVTGHVTLRLPPGKKFEHLGIKVQFIGRIDMSIGIHEGRPHYDFISLSKELSPPGMLFQSETVLPFRFRNMDKEFESYRGRNVSVRYIIRVLMERKFLPPLTKEHDVWVQILGQAPTGTEGIKMEVGIEDCLHIEFEYDRRVHHLQDTIRGKIHFLLVRIKIKHMELAVIRRETSGEGVAIAAANAEGSTNATTVDASNIYTETQTLVKYEIMDGAPVKGEVIPVKLCLKGLPADLTPTYTAVNNRFSVRYFLNLVLVDEDDRRYFKQQEIILWRKELG
jgi:vacuolar protein sorting-associated protein 26